LLELKHEHGVRSQETERVEVDIFDVAHQIIGGGEEETRGSSAPKRRRITASRT
jgi:2-methylcitrate dehydratase PrpD